MPTTTIEKTVKNKPNKALNFSKKQYLKWYKDMLVMRKVEERVGHLYIQQKFGGFFIRIFIILYFGTRINQLSFFYFNIISFWNLVFLSREI